MSLGFVNSRKEGKHFELVKFAVKKLRKVNLQLKAKNEREYEQVVVSYLQSSRKLKNNMITQVMADEVEKITHANLFGFKHRPDVTIGNDGTAIEIKLISSGNQIRDLLGQGLVYRMNYRFVVLVIVDNTSNRSVVELCNKKNSSEYEFLTSLAEDFNIFTIVGPKSFSSNISFFPAIENDKDEKEEDDEEGEGEKDIIAPESINEEPKAVEVKTEEPIKEVS